MTDAAEPTETDAENADEREEAARFVVGASGRVLLQEIAGLPGDAPAHVLTLRKRGLPPVLAALLVDVAHSRKRARARFGDDVAGRLFFTADALAQATSPGIANYHAQYLALLGTVADLGCGAGMDSMALAQAGAEHVVAVEQNAARVVFARANADAFGVTDKITFICGDVQTADWDADAAFCDPSRRETGTGTTQTRRVSANADRYTPPLPFVVDVMTRRAKRGGCVKLSPSLPDAVLNGLGGRVEFLSEKRECKEACLWFGDAHGAAGDALRAAVLLPTGAVVLPAPPPAFSDFAIGGDAPPLPLLRAFVYDPDPALVRANALQTLAARIGGGAGFASAADFYLVGSTPAPPQLAQTFLILHEMVYNVRLLRAWFGRSGYNRVVVKKRHFPQEPPEILRDLGLPVSGGTGKEVVLILARHARKEYRAFVCEPFVPGK